MIRSEADGTYRDGVFADSQCVPQFDGVVHGSGHNLTVVCREGYTQDILVVADE